MDDDDDDDDDEDDEDDEDEMSYFPYFARRCLVLKVYKKESPTPLWTFEKNGMTRFADVV